MRQVMITAIFSLLAIIAHAQSLEDKVTEKSCECMKLTPIFVDSVMIRCISSSMDSVVKADKSEKYKKILSDTGKAINMLKRVHARLLESCKNAIAKPKEE